MKPDIKEKHKDASEKGPGGRILIVSVDRALRSSLSLYFEREYEVNAVSTCEEASEALERQPIDLLLLDVGLFDEGVEALVKSVRAAPRKVAVVLMYVYRESLRGWETRIRCNVDAIYYKPVDVAQLAERIREILTTDGNK